MIEEEILSILEEFGALSSKEIETKLRLRGINLKARTIRYHLKKLEERGLIRRNSSGKAELTEDGTNRLKRNSAFERLGEFSERIEFNVYFCDFDLYRMRGIVPTNVAVIDKNDFDQVMSILKELRDFPFLIHNSVAFADEGETLGNFEVPKGKFAIGTISNTIYDVILRSVGINTYPEFTALLSVEDMQPKGITELISYVGTTLSPGWLLLKSGLTSVNLVRKTGRGEILAAVRTFSRYAIDLVKKEIEIAISKGFRGVIAILHPADKRFPLPIGRRARIIISAGLNHLAPLHESGVKMDIMVNEIFVDFSEFKLID